jgi:hypothetical protein
VDVSLSTTAFNDAARCLKRYEYRWVENLVPKPRDVRPAMRRGVWLHRCLQLHDQGEMWTGELALMGRWAVDHGVPESDVLQTMRETYELVQDYIAYWAGHEESPGPWRTDATEVKVDWEPQPGVRLTSTIDCLKRDASGKLWIWERKSTADIPDSNWRGVDPQTMLQYIEARARGLQITGIVFDYISTRPGTAPRVTQKGALYKGDEDKQVRGRAWAQTEQELRAKGAAESYIDEMRSRIVSDGSWFQRYYTFRPDDNAMLTLRDVSETLRHVARARQANYYPRSINLLDCRLFCPYGKLCMREYALGRKSEAYREEYMTPGTDDLYYMGRTDVE